MIGNKDLREIKKYVKDMHGREIKFPKGLAKTDRLGMLVDALIAQGAAIMAERALERAQDEKAMRELVAENARIADEKAQQEKANAPGLHRVQEQLPPLEDAPAEGEQATTEMQGDDLNFD